MEREADEQRNVVELTNLIRRGPLAPPLPKSSSAGEGDADSALSDFAAKVEKLSSRLALLEQRFSSFEHIQKRTKLSVEEHLQSMLSRLEQIERGREQGDSMRLEKALSAAGERSEKQLAEIASKIDAIEIGKSLVAEGRQEIFRKLDISAAKLDELSNAVADFSRQRAEILAGQESLSKTLEALEKEGHSRRAEQERHEERLRALELRVDGWPTPLDEDAVKKIATAACAQVLREEIAAILKG